MTFVAIGALRVRFVFHVVRNHNRLAFVGQLTVTEIKLFACWVILHAFVVVCRIFSKLTFSKNLSGILSGCQTVWMQIRM